MANDVLLARGVRKTYDLATSPVLALRGVDLDVAAGELVAVTGPSGCGKSTLLHCLAGLEPVDGGSIELAGERVDGRSESELARLRRRMLGLVFQAPSLLEGMSALENVRLAASVGGVARREATRRAADLLDLLGLAHRAGDAPESLSGGQRQLVAIARALVNRPAVLLADEPTGALDSESEATVLQVLRDLNHNGQTALVMTHSPVVAAAATRVVSMADGRVTQAGRLAGTRA